MTPSAARKIKDKNEHVQVTASKGSRGPSYTRRITLDPHSTGERRTIESTDDKTITSYPLPIEESSLAHRYPPVEIEMMHRDQDRDLSGLNPAREKRYSKSRSLGKERLAHKAMENLMESLEWDEGRRRKEEMLVASR